MASGVHAAAKRPRCGGRSVPNDFVTVQKKCNTGACKKNLLLQLRANGAPFGYFCHLLTVRLVLWCGNLASFCSNMHVSGGIVQ
jgi:hypothetical protein